MRNITEFNDEMSSEDFISTLAEIGEEVCGDPINRKPQAGYQDVQELKFDEDDEYV